MTATRTNEHAVLIAEASDLGLRPGEWPRTLDAPDGDGPPFQRVHMTDQPGGDVISVTYHSADGRTLVVFND